MTTAAWVAVLMLQLAQGKARPPARTPLGVPSGTVPAVDSTPTRVAQEIAPADLAVGTPFTLTLRLRVPRGTAVDFPVGPDSGSVEALASRVRRQEEVGADSVDEIAEYRLVPWRTGELTIPLGDAVIGRGAAIERIRTGLVRISVVSVLSGNPDETDPKPARDFLGFAVTWWQDVVAVLVVAGLASLLLWWASRRIKTRPPPRAVFAQDPIAALDALTAFGLEAAGEPSTVMIGAADAVREALRQTEPSAASLTTEQLVVARFARPLPMARIVALLEAGDAAKFSRAAVGRDRAAAALAEAREIVRLLRDVGTAA